MPERIPRIVAGVGELAPGDPTLMAAAALAGACGAELHLVHAYQVPAWMAAPPAMEAAYPEATTRYGEMLEAALEAAARAHPGGEQARLHVVPGPPGPVLSGLARELDADLLMVGAARGSRLGRAILGTTAQRVLRHATVRGISFAPSRWTESRISNLSAAFAPFHWARFAGSWRP